MAAQWKRPLVRRLGAALLAGMTFLSPAPGVSGLDVQGAHDWWSPPSARHPNLPAAFRAARTSKKPVFIYFCWKGSDACRKDVRRFGAVRKPLLRYETVTLTGQKHPFLLKRFGLEKFGAVVLGSRGGAIAAPFTETDPDRLAEALKELIEEARKDDSKYIEQLSAFLKKDEGDGMALFKECVERCQMPDARKVLARLENGKVVDKDRARLMWARACLANEIWSDAKEIFRLFEDDKDEEKRCEAILGLAEAEGFQGDAESASLFLRKILDDPDVSAGWKAKAQILQGELDAFRRKLAGEDAAPPKEIPSAYPRPAETRK